MTPLLSWLLIDACALAALIVLWRRLGPKKRRFIESHGIRVETDDPLAAAVIARAMRSRGPVVGRRNDDGTVEIEEIENNKEKDNKEKEE